MYFCSDNVRTSVRKPERAVEVMPVRRRLMKAVFFFRDESRELLTSRTPEIASAPVAKLDVAGCHLSPQPKRGN